VLLEGNVRVNQGGNRFVGPKAEINIGTTEGYFEAPRFEINSVNGLGQGRGNASRINFKGPELTEAENVTYSTCPRPPGGTWAPDWFVSASSIEFDQKADTGTARGAVLRFKGVPVIGSPWISFPLSDERKSGFLPPTVNLDTVSGLELTVPYYLNIAPNHDATLYPTFMTKRGVDLAGEYRYLGTNFSGRFRGAYMPNDTLRNTDRWGWTWQHQQALNASGLPVRFNANLNRVSDGDYWRDFPRSTTSLTSRLLANDVSLSTGENLWQASAGAYKWETLQSAGTDRIDEPYDRYQLAYRVGSRGTLGRFQAMDWSVDSELTQFDKPTNNTLDGQRLVVAANLSRRYETSGGYITPGLRVHSRNYQMDQALTTGPWTGRRQATVTTSTFTIDSGLVFDADRGDARQTLEPRIVYAQTPYRNQTGLPNYDSGEVDFNLSSIYSPYPFSGNDRVADTRTLTTGLTTRWFNADGRESFNLTVAQRRRLRDQYQSIADGAAPLTESLSDILLGGTFNPSEAWRLDAVLQVDADTNRTKRSTARVTYHPGSYRTVSLAYRLQRDVSELIDVSWQWPLNDLWGDRGVDQGPGKGLGAPRWYSVGRVNYSQKDQRVADMVTGFEYDAGCWVGRVVLERVQTATNESTDRLLFQLEFVGFSRIGANPLATLSANIPRYQYLRQEVNPPSRFQNYD
jgi:LPS-assembly protein